MLLNCLSDKHIFMFEDVLQCFGHSYTHNLDLLELETVSGSGISWAICKSTNRSRQLTTPAPHHSVFYRPDALHAARPTTSKH